MGAARVGDAIDVDDVELAVQRRCILDDRVEVIVVLLGADSGAELDAADPRLLCEAGRGFLGERAGSAGRRAVDPVVRRLHRAVGVLPRAGAPDDRARGGAGVHPAGRRHDDVSDDVREQALRMPGRATLDSGAGAGREIDVDVALAAVDRAEEPDRRGRVDGLRVTRVDLDREAEGSLGDARRLGPALAEVRAVEGALAGEAAATEGRVTADREYRPAVRFGPRDRAHDLARQGVADRAPVVSEILGKPDPAGALRRKEALVDGVVPEAVDPALVVDEAEPVDRAVPRVVDDQRAVAVLAPDAARAGHLRAVLGQILMLVDRVGVCARSDPVVRRAADGLLLLLALDQLDELLGMLRRDADAVERAAGQLSGLAGAGALGRRLYLALGHVARGTCLRRLLPPRMCETDTSDDKCGQQSRAEQSDGLAHLPASC